MKVNLAFLGQKAEDTVSEFLSHLIDQAVSVDSSGRLTDQAREQILYSIRRAQILMDDQSGDPVVWLKKDHTLVVSDEYSEEGYLLSFGESPRTGDLDQVNCKVTHIGHSMCGVCSKHYLPRRRCGCYHSKVQEQVT